MRRPVFLALLLSLSLVAPEAQAKIKCFWLLRNRTYKEGEIVKSPMKVEPLPIRLANNVMFWAGMIAPVQRNMVERSPNFLSDYEFLQEKRYDNRLGKVNTFFDHEFDTRVYHTLTARALPDGSVPVIDPDAKGLFIYIHGSGTSKASGATFSYKSTELSRLGFAALSFDLPFHADGSLRKKYATTSGFMKMLDDIIKKYRIPGKPVYLAGHSFGPEVVFEYAKRYPQGVDGVVALSPAAFNADLNDWFRKATSQATGFWGDTKPSKLGGVWGAHATGDSQWNNPKSELPDPTQENPNLKIVALTGDWEEYAPGPMLPSGEPAKESRTYDICAALRKFMKGIYCIKEPGVGHYIFAHQDQYKNDIVTRELLRVTLPDKKAMDAFPAQMPVEIKKMAAETNARALAETDKVAQKYAREPFFRKWMDDHAGGLEHLRKLIAENSQRGAVELQQEYALVLQQREKKLLENVRDTKKTDPEFYNANKELYSKVFDENGERTKASADGLIGKYFDRLSKMDETFREANYKADASVFKVAVQEPRVTTKKPAAGVVSSGPQTIKLSDGSDFTFDKDVPPDQDQIEFVFNATRAMRDAKMFKESQPLLDWLRRWVNYKSGKDRAIESWSYKPEAGEYFKGHQ